MERQPFRVCSDIGDLVGFRVGAGPRVLLLHGGPGLTLHVATTEPDRLTGVMALDPLGAVDDGGLAEFNETLLARADPLDLPRVEELMALPDDDATESDHAELMGLLWAGYFSRRDAAPPAPDTPVSAAAAAGLWPDLLERMPALAESLPGVELPMTLVGCSGSPVSVDAVRRTAELLPHAELEVLDGVGHFPWMEQPGLVAAALRRLRARCDALRDG